MQSHEGKIISQEISLDYQYSVFRLLGRVRPCEKRLKDGSPYFRVPRTPSSTKIGFRAPRSFPHVTHDRGLRER